MLMNNTNKMVWVGLVFSLVYIILEISFNLGLIDFINSKNTEIATFDKLETLGRLLSSVGFSLFITKLLMPLFNKINKYITPAFFVLFAGAFYIGETVVFNKIVDNLTPQQKFYAYTFGVYRNLSLNGQVDNTIFKSENKSYDNVVNAMFGVLASQDNITKNVQNSTKQFFAVEFQLDKKSLGDIYDKIQVSTLNDSIVYDYYKRYVIESRRIENYHGPMKNKYIENFTNSIGIPPSLDEASFNQAFRDKYTPKADFKKVVIVPKNDRIHMSQLTLSDIPEGLDKEQWIGFIDNHIQSSINKASLSVANVETLPHSRNIISSVIITPIAIILSLFAIVLNISVLIGKKHKVIGVAFIGIIFVVLALWNYNPYNINTILNKVIGLETRFVQLFTPYKNIIHSTFVNDKNPNLFDIVRIDKPQIPDAKNSTNKIKKEFDELSEKNNGMDTQRTQESKELYIDDNKLNNQNYYGELNKKNPYLK